MAKRLSEEQWLEIKTKYQMGVSNNSIAMDFGIPESTIRARAKRENWTQKLRSQVTDIKSKITEIANECEPSQIPIVKQVIDQEITDAMQIAKSITNLQKGALNLHNVVIKRTIDGVNSGKLGVKEASQVLANTGLKVDQIHRMNNPDSPLIQNNIQNNNTANSVSDANLEAVVKRVLSSEDDSIINNLEEMC